jgi:hypothetical protein
MLEIVKYSNKTLGPQRKVPMDIITIANQLFEKCSLDIVASLPETQRGNIYIYINLLRWAM